MSTINGICLVVFVSHYYSCSCEAIQAVRFSFVTNNFTLCTELIAQDFNVCFAPGPPGSKNIDIYTMTCQPFMIKVPVVVPIDWYGVWRHMIIPHPAMSQ